MNHYSGDSCERSSKKEEMSWERHLRKVKARGRISKVLRYRIGSSLPVRILSTTIHHVLRNVKYLAIQEEYRVFL